MPNYTIINGELYHYGVLGMKWGQRRSQAQLAKIDRKAKKKNWSEDATTAAKIRKKKVKQMSNADLKKLNERIRLENEYRNLTKSSPSAGRKFATEVTREVGKEIAKDFVKKKAKEGIKFGAAFVKSWKEA